MKVAIWQLWIPKLSFVHNAFPFGNFHMPTIATSPHDLMTFSDDERPVTPETQFQKDYLSVATEVQSKGREESLLPYQHVNAKQMTSRARIQDRC